jgi:hypothetical protein
MEYIPEGATKQAALQEDSLLSTQFSSPVATWQHQCILPCACPRAVGKTTGLHTHLILNHVISFSFPT